MCPERKLCKNLNSNIIRLLPHNNCTIKNTSHGYNHRKLPGNCNIKMHQSKLQSHKGLKSVVKLRAITIFLRNYYVEKLFK